MVLRLVAGQQPCLSLSKRSASMSICLVENVREGGREVQRLIRALGGKTRNDKFLFKRENRGDCVPAKLAKVKEGSR